MLTTHKIKRNGEIFNCTTVFCRATQSKTMESQGLNEMGENPFVCVCVSKRKSEMVNRNSVCVNTEPYII